MVIVSMNVKIRWLKPIVLKATRTVEIGLATQLTELGNAAGTYRDDFCTSQTQCLFPNRHSINRPVAKSRINTIRTILSDMTIFPTRRKLGV